MTAPACSEQEFRKIVAEHGKTGAARVLGVGVRSIFSRIKNIERTGQPVEAPAFRGSRRLPFSPADHPQRHLISIQDGTIIIGSDAHYWPGKPTAAHRALIRLAKELEPRAIVMNGDVMDCATISKYAPIGWESRPPVIQELEAAQERLHEIEQAAPHAELVWPLGNHDARFETRLASQVPEYAKLKGFHLHDHFGNRWQACWGCWINDDIVSKHKFKGGIHHAHLDTLWSGVTMITGDKHALQITAFSDYNGTRFGIDTGMIADPYAPQFRDYSEDNPRTHRSGFVVLTFNSGRLMWPEVVHAFDSDNVEFRGKIIDVSEAKAPRDKKAKAAPQRLRRRRR